MNVFRCEKHVKSNGFTMKSMLLQFVSVSGPIFGQVFRTNQNKYYSKYKKIAKIEAKRGPKMRSKLFGESNIFLNGPRWVVFRRSLFYYSKTMVRDDPGLQKSMQI